VITLHTTVHDSSVTLFPDTFLGDLVVNPVGETPHGVINLAKFHGSASVVLDGGPELLVEVAIVQEDVRVMIPAVEVALNRLERLDHTFQLLVPCQNDKGSIGARFLVDTILVNGQTARREDFVMLFANFSVGKDNPWSVIHVFLLSTTGWKIERTTRTG
jgi:hypothetical protein